MITLDSPRLGSWHSGVAGSEVQNRAMEGSIAMFRVWSYQHSPPSSAEQDYCPPPGVQTDQTRHVLTFPCSPHPCAAAALAQWCAFHLLGRPGAGQELLTAAGYAPECC